MTTETRNTQTQRHEYLTQLERRLAHLEGEFHRLQADVERSTMKPSAKLAELQKTIESKRVELRNQLAKAGNAGESAWKEIQDGLESAWKDLSGSFERARAELRTGHQAAPAGSTTA